MSYPIPTLPQRYQLKHQLGQAPGRETWLAEDTALQPPEQVVVKLLAFGGTTQWEDLKLFQREAQVLQQLDHAQIPKYRDSFSIEQPQQWFGLVQDYIPGKSLKQLLDDGKHFTERQILQIAVNLLHLLGYLHELSPPVLHRDIKPSNLIWGTDNFIYLVDFGAVQNRAAREGATFTVVGTYGYAPLEQFGGRAVPASDLYGLGATLIHLLTGLPPAELPQKDLKIQFADRVSLNPTFVRWIERLVEPDVTKRFQTTRQALDALRSPPPELAEKPATQAEVAVAKTVAKAQGQLLQPPLETHLEVYQTPAELTINIPGTTSWELLLLLPPVAIVLVALAQVLPFTSGLPLDLGIVGLFLAIAGSTAGYNYWQSLPTRVHFDRQNFSIFKQVFGSTICLSSGSTTTLKKVSHSQKPVQRGSKSWDEWLISLETSTNEELFGKGLSQEEGSWLAETIQTWLLQKQV